MALASASGVVFLWGVWDWLRTDQDEWWFVTCAPLFFAVGVASLVLGATALVRKTWRPQPAVSRVPLLLVAAAAGVVVAAPVELRWDDGCNDHEARVPAGLSAFVLILKPANGVPYIDSSTLILCPN